MSSAIDVTMESKEDLAVAQCGVTENPNAEVHERVRISHALIYYHSRIKVGIPTRNSAIDKHTPKKYKATEW